MKRSLILLVLSSAGCGSSPPDAHNAALDSDMRLVLAGELDPGPHSVGFRKETVPLPETPGSPSAVDLYTWYPSSGDPDGTPMSFADYYRAQEETPADEPLRDRLLVDMTSPPGADEAMLDAVLAAPMWAAWDAPEATGPWPLVLWSYRDSVPTMQALLSEYVASHGYIVAFAWPVDHAPPLPWEEGLTPLDKSRALDAQVFVLDSVLSALASRPAIDGEAAAVLSWSYGGESANALAQRRDELRLAIGVDATLASGWVFRSAEDLTAMEWSSVSTPYALLRNGRPYLEAEASSGPSPLRDIAAGSWFLRFPALSHGNFNFPGGMLPGVLELDEVSRWAVGGERARLGYEMVCRHVVALLDYHLRDRAGDAPPGFPSSPEGFVEIERHSPPG